MNESYQTEEISLLEIFEAVKEGVWTIILLVLIGGIVASVATLALEEVEYETQSTMVIGKEEAKLFYEDRYTQNDINMYEKTANTYIEIAHSNKVVKEVAEQYPDYSEAEIRQMVKPSYKSGTLIIELIGRGKHRKDVMDITNSYTSAFMRVSTEILPVGEIMLIDEAELPQKRIPSKFLLNTIIGVMLGGVIAMLLILFKMFRKSNTIQTEEEINTLMNLPVISVIE